MEEPLWLILSIIAILLGAYYICDAIKRFNSKEYYIFGMRFMLTCWTIILLYESVHIGLFGTLNA